MTPANMQLSDWLDDLCVRFIINLPHEELASVERICFQVEEAQWFYEDFVRPQNPGLPSLNLKEFCLRIFQHCPLLSEYSSYHHAAAFSEFLAYKERVPVRGAILLNDAMDQVVLVKGWKKSASWSFPRGKINKAEPDLDCAMREVYEETGFDLRATSSVGGIENSKYIEMTIREQHMRLYIFTGVPTDAQFEPRTRKEISAIQWYKLSELPTLKKQKQHDGRSEDLALNANKFYMVAPFLVPLKKWISKQKKNRKSREVSHLSAIPTMENTVSSATNDQTSTSVGSSASIMKTLGIPMISNEPRAMSDLPEVSKPVMSLEDTSAQLKSLLGVPAFNSLHTPSKAYREKEVNSDSEYLLALLRPKDGENLPQSSLVEQISSTEKNTPSPKIPEKVNPDKVGQPQINRESLPHQKIVDPQVNHQILPSHQQNGNQMNHQPALHQKNGILQVNHQPIPPYRRTGDALLNQKNSQSHEGTDDPQFASNLQLPQKDAVSIPAANKLPLPTLTTHSSTLLSLFKETKPSKVRSSISPTSFELPDEDFRFSPGKRKNGELAGTPLPKSSSMPMRETETSDKAKAEHRDKLLTLFRPSMTETPNSKRKNSKHSPQNLDLLSPLVELSALPSPAHSRVPSNIDTAPLNVELNATMKSPALSQARPKNQSVFATVNGPLNVPQFGVLAKSLKDSRGKLPKDKNTNSSKASSNGRLSQPTSSVVPPVPDTNDSLPTLMVSNKGGGKLSHSHGLRRADQTSRLSKEIEVPSPMSPLPPPRHFPRTDDNAKQTQDHKKTLLSLFNKALPATSPGSFSPTIKTNPVIEKPYTEKPSPQDPSPLITPLTSRSRVGSYTSTFGEGRIRSNDVRQTPGTTSVDKDFLLGYLNGVASGEKR